MLTYNDIKALCFVLLFFLTCYGYATGGFELAWFPILLIIALAFA